jgi:hypothetical protein
MGPSHPIRYHRAALEMLGAEPRPSPERRRLIAEREHACGVAFPPSVVEWFALEDAAALFHDNSNEDRLEPLESLGEPAETRQGYLRVAVENQAVVAFYVRLDEGDDPPVYDNNDEFGQEDLSRIAWNPLSASFSNYVFDMASIGRLHAFGRDLWLETEGPVPTGDLAGLRPGPVTRGEAEIRRFFGPHEHATVRWAPGAGTAQWQLQADSPERLDDLAASLGFTDALAARRRPQTSKGAAARLLARLRRR